MLNERSINKAVGRLSSQERARLTSKQRQEQILDTAMRLFAQKGFDRTTIDDVAEACGVAPGLIYHYFDSKIDLLRSAIKRSGFLQTLKEILHQPPKPTVEATLLEIANAYWTMLEKNREFALMMLSERHRNPEVMRLVGSIAKEGLKLMTRYFAQRAEAGEVRKDADFEVAMRVFFSALIEFFFAQHRLSLSLKKLTPERFINELVRLLVDGLKAR